MKRVITVILALVMLLSVIPFTVSAAYKTPFEDVKTSDYFYEPVIWAYSEGITTGTTATKFAPQSTCTRGQVVTFLWRAMGKPEPTSTTNPFEDVKTSDYYYKPILWAVEKGITTGTSAKRFSPDVTCTNAHILTFIWRALGEEGKTGTGEWYTDAENWAKNGGLLEGTYTGDFTVTANCPRANVVTYLYKYLEAGKLTVYVSASADAKTADGSVEKPFPTIEAARDYVRTIDKSKYTGINVRVNAGEYSVAKTIKFTKADSGTASCPIRYVGEEGTVIEGLVHLTANDFAPATGAYTKYFSDGAKDNIVQLDLKKYGYTKDDIKALYYISEGKRAGMMTLNIREDIPILCADDAFLTIARYPNTEVALSRPGSTAAHNGEPIDAESAIDYDDEYIVYTDEEHIERVRSWHSLEKVYTDMYLSSFWCEESSRMLRVSDTELCFATPFSGGHNPQKNGMPIYWYNIPEELDCPGEYIIDDDAILYIYKPDNFSDVSYTIVRGEGLLDIQNADYITFGGFVFEGCSQLAVNVRADSFTFSGNIIRIIQRKGAEIYGSNNKITGNEFYNIGYDVLDFGGGDAATLTRSNNLCENNYIHDYGVLYPDESNGISVNGIGDTVSHNEVTGGPQCAIGVGGNLNVAEYNYIHDTMTTADDLGAFSSAGEFTHYGNVYRYNFLERIGPSDKAYQSGENPDYWPACGVSAFYFDFHCSGNKVYGNVVNGVYGNGMFTLGKMNKYTGNLVVGAAEFSFNIGHHNGYPQFREDQSQLGPQARPSYITETWLKEFPELKRIKWNKYDSIDDPDYWATPSGTVVKNNVTILDKGNWSKGLAGNKMKGYNIDQYVKQFSDIEETELLYVNSKRDGYSIDELVKEYADTLEITYEQFKSIGRY